MDIIFRDLKLENVLLDENGHVRLTDFGLAKQLVSSDSDAVTICGTTEYMAPEILKNDRYTTQVDWWSLGVILYTMLAGKYPFRASNRLEMYEKILHTELVYPAFFSANARSLLSLLLQQDADKRLSSLAELEAHPFMEGLNFADLRERKPLAYFLGEDEVAKHDAPRSDAAPAAAGAGGAQSAGAGDSGAPGAGGGDGGSGAQNGTAVTANGVDGAGSAPIDVVSTKADGAAGAEDGSGAGGQPFAETPGAAGTHGVGGGVGGGGGADEMTPRDRAFSNFSMVGEVAHYGHSPLMTPSDSRLGSIEALPENADGEDHDEHAVDETSGGKDVKEEDSVSRNSVSSSSSSGSSSSSSGGSGSSGSSGSSSDSSSDEEEDEDELYGDEV